MHSLSTNLEEFSSLLESVISSRLYPYNFHLFEMYFVDQSRHNPLCRLPLASNKHPLRKSSGDVQANRHDGKGSGCGWEKCDCHGRRNEQCWRSPGSWKLPQAEICLPSFYCKDIISIYRSHEWLLSFTEAEQHSTEFQIQPSCGPTEQGGNIRDWWSVESSPRTKQDRLNLFERHCIPSIHTCIDIFMYKIQRQLLHHIIANFMYKVIQVVRQQFQATVELCSSPGGRTMTAHRVTAGLALNSGSTGTTALQTSDSAKGGGSSSMVMWLS